jgi:hypothetical protein
MSSHPPGADGDLPFVDEHWVLVSAPSSAVWRSLAAQFARPGRPARGYAHLIAAEPRRVSGELFEEGSTVPGFRVADVVAEQRVRLAGRHLFSRYVLDLALSVRPDGTRFSARTYAEFPGLHGAVYRVVVIGSRGHRVLVRRMLQSIRRRAEATR